MYLHRDVSGYLGGSGQEWVHIVKIDKDWSRVQIWTNVDKMKKGFLSETLVNGGPCGN
jgi:hypothetical protein